MAKWHNLRLQQMRTSPNAAAVDTETKEEKLLTFGRILVGRDLQQDTLISTANPYMRPGKGWILAPPLSRSHLRVGSGGAGVLLVISAYLRPSEGKQFFFLCFCVYGCRIWACSHLLQPRIVSLCYYCCTLHHIIALQYYTSGELY